MSKKQWLVLLMLFLMYLFLGASIFYHIEGQLELENVEEAKQERIEINALLREHYVPSGSHDFEEILAKVTEYCGKSVYNYTVGEVDRLRWDFYNSFYFSYTVVSTIGYGNLAPTNMLSRILMIFYGLVGIPMNGILLTQLGEYFGVAFVKAHRKYKSYKRSREHYNPKKLTPFETRKVGLAAQICAYLIPGFVMFIFFPAFLFSHYEGWTYDQAVYYAFVTLTTIGFGDIVAGQDNTKGSGAFFIMYKIFLIAWISFGLGYIVMIMTFIARGMRSKRIKGLEHRLAVNLKHTQSKIWNEFHKEVNFLRRVFNELQLSKVKRVYVDEYEYEVPPAKLPRSNSFPDLRSLTFFGEPDMTAIRPRRRANSEVVPVDDQIARVVSETDLQRIDKTATFATHAMVQPAELLARLVNILGYIPPSEDAEQPEPDYRSEKDKEEQTTDWWYDTKKDFTQRRSMSTVTPWRMGNDYIPPTGKPRSRAASEVRLYETRNDMGVHQRNVEWTWSGTPTSKKMQELINAQAEKAREANAKSVGPKMSVFRSLGLSMPKSLIPLWKRQSSNKKTADIESGIRSPDRMDSRENYNSQNGTITQNGAPYSDDRRESISRRHYYTHTGANATDFYEGSNLLEETSLADFLRALTVLHAGVGSVSDKYVGKPRRKMGTASLTPPKLPSLFTLFSSPPPDASGVAGQSSQNTIPGMDRRLSLNVAEGQPSGASTPSARRGSFAFIKPRRRFSLRPVATPISPPTPPNLESPAISHSRDPSGESKFLFESSKEPLIQMETAPGISSPMKPVPGSRRSSLRPIPSGVEMSTSPPPSPTGPLSKPLPRWKAGMLQRQIGQMNLRRRVRAFSLSDVHADDQIRGKKSFEPLEMGGTGSRLKKLRPEALNESISKTAGDTVRKSVTLLSPKRGQIFWPAQDDEPVPMNVVSAPGSSENVVTSEKSSETNAVVQKDTDFTAKPESGDITVPGPAKEASLVDVKVTQTSLEVADPESKDTRVSAVVKDSKHDSKTSKSKPSDSKPRVSIEHYEVLSEVKIEKPAENPFERYRAATSTPKSRDTDADRGNGSKRKFGVNKRT